MEAGFWDVTVHETLDKGIAVIDSDIAWRRESVMKNPILWPLR